MEDFDLIVIGAGPAGVSGALAAAVMGARTVLVERDAELGGAGINTGTVPSKTLRETALALSGLRARRLHGVDLSLRREASVADFTRHRDNVVRGERERVAARLAQYQVARRTGEAHFVDPHVVEVASADGGVQRLRGAHVLIATGSSPFRPPAFAFEHPRVHDSDEILRIECLPRVLTVIGAGVIGSEYASTFAALGTEVHLVDGRDALLPFLDDEISRLLASAMADAGIALHLGAQVERCAARADGKIAVRLASGEELACDDVLVCSGRTSNTAALGLERAGVATGTRGLVLVDADFRTSVPHILAAGDVIGSPALAATGMEQARAAVTRALGGDRQHAFATLLPCGIYTIPEVGSVGATEEALRADGIDYVAGRWRAADTPRGCILGDRHGLIKLLFRRGDMRLLGVHVLGEQATESVHVGMVAMLCDAGADLFDRACFNYPTLGDLYKLATYDALLQVRGGGSLASAPG